MRTGMRFTAQCILLASSTLISQAKSQPPLFAAPDFNPKQIDRIDVFVVDSTNDNGNHRECIGGAKFGSFNRQSGAQDSLAKRGYNKHLDKITKTKTRFYEAPIPISGEMLTHPDKAWLQDLSSRKYFNAKSKEIPPPGRWIMIITLDELGSGHNAVKGLGKATLSMYLFDRDQGALLWHDQKTDEHMWGGLLGNLMQKGEIKQGACGDVVFSMVMKLPKR